MQTATNREENDSIRESANSKVKAEIFVNNLPECGLVRLSQILGNRRKGIPPIIPISKSSWWAGVKTGRYPKPVKLSARCTCWRVEDIRALVAQAGN